MYTIVKGENNNLQQKPINSISVLLKDKVIQAVTNVYVLTQNGIKLAWTAIKEILSAFGAGYWLNDKGWRNDIPWKN